MSSSRAKLKLDNGVIQGARCPSLEEWPCGESLGEADSRAILRRRPQLACVTGAFDLSAGPGTPPGCGDRKSTRLNSSHGYISYAVFCLKKKNSHYAFRSEECTTP